MKLSNMLACACTVFVALSAVGANYVRRSESNGWQWYSEIGGSSAMIHSGSVSAAIDKNTSGHITVPYSFTYNSATYYVKIIGAYAFLNCSNITEVSFFNLGRPSLVEVIGQQAFNNCTSLKSISISDYVTNIYSFAFFECSSLTNIILPSVRSIGSQAFGNCRSLKEVTLSTECNKLGFRAFTNCTSLTKIDIPRAVNEINESFAYCPNLTIIEVDGDNPNFSSLGGVLYNKTQTQLISCPGGLTSLRIPETVTNIEQTAFLGCNSLKTIYLPVSLCGNVAESVFEECASDVEIFYYGPLYTVADTSLSIKTTSGISITPTTRNFEVGGGGGAIITSGSGTWTAEVSDSWITLNATSGTVGYPVAYTVSVNTNVEQRTGYVYVSGYTHTITQDGVGATITPENASFEAGGGTKNISVSAQDKAAWKAIPNVDWISVSPAKGVGADTVRCRVEPYDEVSTRQGTLTVAGNTFTVFQYGRRMKLDAYSVTKNYETHVIPITVNALAITEWGVTPNASWISVVDAGNGKGSDLVTIAIAENPSYKARTGTVKIGTETFTVTQEGRTALEFSISPTTTTASVTGANGLIAVTATPDLPWTAESGANWLTIYDKFKSGAGTGNIAYSASPNPTLYSRTGTITVTPDDSSLSAATHKVTQPAAVSALSMSGYEFAAAGESCEVDVSVDSIVEWTISENLDWLTVVGDTSRVGPGTVTLQAAANDTVYSRSGTVTIARKTFTVTQKARGVEVEYDTIVFGTDGGYSSISIHPDGNVSWTAVASDTTWITIFQGDSGTGDGEILYIVSPYVGDGTARVGWITVGDKKIYITQKAYDLSIDPCSSWVTGNNGAGEFGVSAAIGQVWEAIVTEPWITLVSGYNAGTGSGTVRFLYTENTTGKTRTGKILVNGEVYTLQQRARTMVAITAEAEHGGSVSGGGTYDFGDEVTLTAIPDSGYKFSYWTGDIESMENPLTITADVAKSVTAIFAPLPIAFTEVASSEDGVTLAWNNLAWAVTYHIYRGVTSVPSSAEEIAAIANDGNCEYLDATGDVAQEYWYWIEAEGAEDSVMSDPMTGKKLKPVVFSEITYENLRGATNPNPSTYQEGVLLTFANPGSVTGYTFAGWTPAQITTDMTGSQTVRASWTANSYKIVYNPGKGSGEMDATECTYDEDGEIAANGFTYYGHVFAGWATEEDGAVVYAAGTAIKNLTAESNGVVTLYAVWEDLVVSAPVISPADGAIFTDDSCQVTITCATDSAVIYYSTKGTPRQTAPYKYTGPFTITDTATIKAIAVCEGEKSEYVTATITKRTITLADALGVGDGVAVTTGDDVVWSPVVDGTAEGGLSAQSGIIDDGEETWLMVAVSGAGTLSFCSKVSCEHDDSDDCEWDSLMVYVDDVERTDWRIDGETGWLTARSVEFTTAGTHIVKWVYHKDDEVGTYDGDDCAWVANVVWAPVEVVEPIPEVADDSGVSDALEGSGDAENLKANITTKSEYDAYRDWANAKSTAEAVKASAFAWTAFALDAPAMVARTEVIEEDDIEIGDISSSGDAGTFTIEVGLKDIEIGDEAVSERLVKVFGLTGASELDESKFSADNVTLESGESVDGKVKLTAKPKDAAQGDGQAFFMRVRVNQ